MWIRDVKSLKEKYLRFQNPEETSWSILFHSIWTNVSIVVEIRLYVYNFAKLYQLCKFLTQYYDVNIFFQWQHVDFSIIKNRWQNQITCYWNKLNQSKSLLFYLIRNYWKIIHHGKESSNRLMIGQWVYLVIFLARNTLPRLSLNLWLKWLKSSYLI